MEWWCFVYGVVDKMPDVVTNAAQTDQDHSLMSAVLWLNKAIKG